MSLIQQQVAEFLAEHPEVKTYDEFAVLVKRRGKIIEPHREDMSFLEKWLIETNRFTIMARGRL